MYALRKLKHTYEKANTLCGSANNADLSDGKPEDPVLSPSPDMCCMRPLGLPCFHMILRWLSEETVVPIPLEEIDVQWHLDPPRPQEITSNSELNPTPLQPAILNPSYVQSKGRPLWDADGGVAGIRQLRGL